MVQQRKILYSILAALVLIFCLAGIVSWFLMLDEANPGTFSFMPDPSDLARQANGLAWTITITIVLLFILAGIFLLMEGKVSQIEIQKKFHYGLAVMFVLIGIAQGVIVFYSMFSKAPLNSPTNYAALLIPEAGDLGRGDTYTAIVLACSSSLFIIHSIEKYIKNSKRYPITIFVVISSVVGIVGLVLNYSSLWTSLITAGLSWGGQLIYPFLLLAGLGIIITIISLPSIYFTLAKQTSGDLKKNSNTIAIGYLITFTMVIFHMLRDMVFAEMPLNWVVFLVGQAIGALILISGYMKSTY